MAFTEEIADKLGFYVYRLIDPRNGETFYVGRGKGNRVFAHAADELGAGADVRSEKLLRIRKIRGAGFEVAHVIHRHGLDSHTAIEVEAALIDAYPGTTNIASGHEADERGVMHADEKIGRYQAPVAQFQHDLVLISVNWSALERSIYEAVRHAWKIDPRKATKADYVLAVHRGLIVPPRASLIRYGNTIAGDLVLERKPHSKPEREREREKERERAVHGCI